MLDELLEQEVVLERVDAYSIYSFYIKEELEIGRAHMSPLRDDDVVPSFALFFWKGSLLFKDHALGMSGGIFKFVQILFGYNTVLDAMSRINIDFDLELLGGNPDIKKSDRVPKLCSNYKVKEVLKGIKVNSGCSQVKMMEFYSMFGITSVTLLMYNATQIDLAQFVYSNEVKPIYMKQLTIAYRIADKYKLYSPFSKDKRTKFLNNYPNSYVEGYLQLKYTNPFLIITKAMKEIMFFRGHFDWDTVAGKSETTMIKRAIMLKLVQKFKYIFIWLDNDVAGQKAQKAYMDEYPFLIPIYYNVEHKDPTDQYRFSEDKGKVLTEIKHLIYGEIDRLDGKRDQGRK